MTTVGYEHIRAHVRSALAICQSLGLHPGNTRFGEYAQRLDTLIDVIERRRTQQSSDRIERNIEKEQFHYMLALVESAEFGEVVNALAGCDAAALKAKLHDVLSGPYLPTDEDSSSKNKSRNTLFELSVAAKLHRAGFEPKLGEHPDLSIVVNERTVCFECKRPSSEAKVVDRLKEAEDQLLRVLNDPRVPRRARGVVAISLSKVMNPGDKLFVYQLEDRGRQGLVETLERAAALYKPVYDRFSRRIIAVIFHVITPGANQSENRYDVAEQLLMVSLAKAGSGDLWLSRDIGGALERIAN